MIKKLIFLLFVSCTLTATESSRTEYLAFVNDHPKIATPQGDASKGEIQILLDPAKIEEIERMTGKNVGIIQDCRSWLI